ncbi:nudix hydrolase [Moniliophthora roreri MCA 2997]|uniref:Nudix hydrolase n=2 Tax=Moniliophthora roreri TaxID=221103 RepID=V2WYI3_MONRO|nr:nudix hydrolase [Moniliophthora roreri MCA 2997]
MSRNATTISQLVAHGFSSLSIQHPPKSKLAAVLILLYENPQSSQLRVLLSTRSKSLRTHPGQTALPGGRKDDTDPDLIYTALREANEEVGLPFPEEYAKQKDGVATTNSIRILCTLEPFLSVYRVIALPVVAFLEDPSVLQVLQPCEGEVDRIFTWPLEGVLDPENVLSNEEGLAVAGSEDWPFNEKEFHKYEDTLVPVLNNTSYRYHRFRSAASPLTGLTADVLIHLAQIAFAPRHTSYVRAAPDQPLGYDLVLEILQGNGERKLEKMITNEAAAAAPSVSA